MKKIVIFIISLLLVLCTAACAMAVTVSGTITSTSSYVNVTSSYATKTAGKTKWNAPFNGASSSQRVVVRVYQLNNTSSAASATWVYSGYSTTDHAYKTEFAKATEDITVFLAAKVDDRDEGPITISGSFNPNRS